MIKWSKEEDILDFGYNAIIIKQQNLKKEAQVERKLLLILHHRTFSLKCQLIKVVMFKELKILKNIFLLII